MRGAGSLIVVGTGYQPATHTTPEALFHIQRANKLFYLVDPVTALWLETVNSSAESLEDSYAAGKDRRESYDEMVLRVLKPVRRNLNVCMALYGHPGVFVDPSHEAVRRARSEGFEATMLPGISAEDCLFADLGIDPASGCQSFGATDFLLRKRAIDTSSPLVLWQIGAIGVPTHKRKQENWSPLGLNVLSEVLEQRYGPAHEVVIYEAGRFSLGRPVIQSVPLACLSKAAVTTASTLYVPPIASNGGRR